jgi:hypothetical protein
MRQIKFMGWNKNTKKMLDLQALTSLVTEVEGLFLPRSEDIVLLQSTDCFNEKGQEIYESYIIKVKDLIYSVEYAEGSLVIKDIKGNRAPIYLIDTFNFEIIGNIYENPELLK